MEFDPGYPQLHAKIADVYRQKSEWRREPGHEKERQELARQAIAFYGSALALNPFQSEVWLHLARAYEVVEENDLALKTYRRAIDVDPVNPLNFQFLGRFYRAIGDEKKAVDAFNRAYELNWGYNDVIAPINLEDLRSK